MLAISNRVICFDVPGVAALLVVKQGHTVISPLPQALRFCSWVSGSLSVALRELL